MNVVMAGVSHFSCTAPVYAARRQESTRLLAVSSGWLHLTSTLNLVVWLPQLAVISSYLAMPNNPKSDGSVMTVWLQVRAVS